MKMETNKQNEDIIYLLVVASQMVWGIAPWPLQVGAVPIYQGAVPLQISILLDPWLFHMNT